MKLNRAYLHTAIIGIGATIIASFGDSLSHWSQVLTGNATGPKAVFVGGLLAGLSRAAGYLVALIPDDPNDKPVNPQPPATHQ